MSRAQNVAGGSLVTLSVLLLPTRPHPQGAADLFNVSVKNDVMVPMRDGVRLATDIYFPARIGQPVAEKLPVILSGTPYNKQAAPQSMMTTWDFLEVRS